MRNKAANDEEIRRRALDPAASFLVEAPAGSGKTELLIQRYLRLLALVSQPESIVALTFTRKAAAEMKERVLAALRDAAAEIPVQNEYARATRLLAAAALAQSAAQEWDIIEDSGRLQIGTIDSFCSLLTRQMPLLSQFGSTPDVIEFAGEMYRLAARRAIVALAENGQTQPAFRELSIHFDGNLGRLEEMIAVLLAKRDQWTRKFKDQPLEVLRADIDELLAREPDRRLETAARVWPASLGNPPAKTLNQWCAAAGRFLTQEGKPRKGKPYTGALLSSPEFCKALHLCREPVPEALSDEQWRLICNFIIVLNAALGELERVFRERGEVDFTRISQAAVEALGPPDRPTHLAYRLDFRIEHLLVDEFQDTSLIQYDLLDRLTGQWSLGDNRTLFLVGDPMQSIYRFRDAEVGLFLRAAERGIGGVKLEKLQLTQNFRSTPSIVSWVNDMFQRIGPPADDAQSGAIALRRAQAARKDSGLKPKIHAFIDDTGAEEAAKVVALAQAALSAGSGSIAILVRTRNHLAAILPALRKAGIRYEAVELDALTEEQHILDLLSLTRAIHQLADRLSWIACLRARFCGLTLADLSALLEDQRKTTVYELLLDDERLLRLSPDGRTRALRFREVMTAAVANFGRHPIRKVVEAAWMSLGGPAAVAEENEREDASSFLSLLQASDAGGRISDFSLFEERLKFLFAKPGKHEGRYVQVMTIHKAKGLQFDTVILPQLHGMSRRSDDDLLAWATRLGADGEERFLLAGLPQSGAEEPDAYYKFVTAEAREKDKAEECRLFYVAVTRAKSGLHLLGSAKSKKSGGVCKPSGGFLKLLWMDERIVEQFSAAWEKQAARSAQQTLALTAEKKTILRRLPQNWILPSPAPGVPWRPAYRTETPSEREPAYEWVTETGRHVGTVVHELLRRIAEEGLHRWTPERVDQLTGFIGSELARLGVASVERPGAVSRALTAVKNVITSERGRWILSPHTQAECEWALGGILNDRLESSRIDRTFVDEAGVRWIVDYKTSSHEGAARDRFLAEQKRRYQAQLETYARLLQQSGEPGVAMGLYFPLLDEWVEWTVMEAEPLGTGA